MTAGDRDYVQQLGDVLRRRDAGALRAFLAAQAGRYGDDRQVAAIERQSDDELTTLLHRMILARGDLADLHAESQCWLADHGGVSPGGQPGGTPGGATLGGQPGGTPGGATADGQPRGTPGRGRRSPPRGRPRRPPRPS